ncbi:hypothetical protein CRUP_002031 [Coryphaenoides rupestris]|nr:hypothetical protein CRUP_002031 [Coryphaenoides rupestris]
MAPSGAPSSTVLLLAFCLITPASSTCLTGCSCTDDSTGRSLLCMETSMGHLPDNIPDDLTKIESKTRI